MKQKLYTPFILLFLGLFLTTARLSAQTANTYVYSGSFASTLDPMAGATTIVAASVDDAGSTVQTIPFTFVYEGVNYTQFSASPDGFMKLGPGAVADQFTNTITSTTNIPKLFPFWEDMATGTNGAVSFVVTGSSPNRILKVQWFVTVPRNTTGAANSTMQAWLYETSNVIEFRYGAGGGPTTSASVGINGVTATNFVSITTATHTASATTSNNANTLWPVAGTKYVFVPAAACSGAPGGTASASAASACSGVNFTIGVDGSAVATGVTYTWESSPNNSTWTPVAAATGVVLNTTQTSATWYRRITTCGATSTPSSSVQVLMAAATNCYCTAGANSTLFEKISNVTFNTINNNSSSTAGYENFLAVTTTVTAGASYPVSVTISGGFAADQTIIFIDYNQDGDFTDPDETVFTSGQSVGPHSGSILIPTTATNGPTRMRVRMHDVSASIPNATSCGPSSFGQVEDYTINIFVPPCTITCPANVVVSNDANQCGAIVNFAAPTTTGVCGPVTVSPASGSFFPIGTTTVTATEPGGGTCSFTVRVNDTQAPTITCPANITVNNTPGICGATVTFAAPAATDNCPAVVVTSVPASGSVFGVGTTTVTSTATDASGNSVSCTFTVTVVDNQPPTITCPANITVSNDANQCGAVVTFLPIANDNCPIGTQTPVSLTQSASNTVTALASVACTETATGFHTENSFWRAYNLAPLALSGPLRITTVSFGIENANAAGTGTTQPIMVRLYTQTTGTFPGGTRTLVGSQTFAVPDQTNAVFTGTLGAPVTVPANAVVIYELVALDGRPAGHVFFPGANTGAETGQSFISAVDCAIPTPVTTASIGFPNAKWILNMAGTVQVPGSGTVSTPASGSFFPLGTTTVTSTVTDGAGQTATCTFTVTVNDTQNPVITCPAPITVTTPVGSCVAAVTYAVTATDNCPGVTTARTAGLASGSNFPIGANTVTYTATDASGNISTCSFTITVLDGQLPVISAQPANRTICAGSNTSFSVTSSNAVSYQWQQYIAGVWTNVAGATAATLPLNAVTHSMNDNAYRVNVIGLCTTVTSNFGTLTVNPLPGLTLTATTSPVLTPGQFTTLVAAGTPTGGTYAWFKNGAPRVPTVTGATLSNLGVDDAGTYRVVYTDPNGCVSTSGDVVVSAEGSERLYVAPNPNYGQFWVRFYNTPGENMTISVFNAAGKRVYQRSVSSTLAYTRFDINLGENAANAPGVYLVELRGANGERLGSKQIIVGHR